ncbi:hypothetical protein [Streptomyces sp. NPDC058683]|uniref:hypothetical protein n=1 Tax=Streptomyces sp. NPDC058683 TaxID=3346597 RepID=UPI0036608B92
MTTSLSSAYDTRVVAGRADRVVVARNRPEARAGISGRMLGEDRMTRSLGQRSPA